MHNIFKFDIFWWFWSTFFPFSNTYDSDIKAVDGELDDIHSKHGVALLVSKTLMHRIVPTKVTNPHFSAVMLNAGNNYDIKILIISV